MKFIQPFHQKRIVLGATLFALCGASAFAAGETSAQFLKLGAGARQAAMGETGATVTDVTAGYWNPAGLTELEGPQLALMQNSFLEDTAYQYLGGATKKGDNAFGFTLQRMDFGSIEGYSVSDARTSDFDASALAGAFNYGRSLNERFSVGASVKFIQEDIENESASAFALDFGGRALFNRFNFGISIQNLGSKMKFVEEEEKLPTVIRMGVDRGFLEKKLLAAFDISKAIDDDPTFHLGLEYRLFQNVQLRGGYQVTPGNDIDVDGLTNVTGGFGVNLGQLNLDYAFVPFGDLGDTHRFSLAYHFQKN